MKINKLRINSYGKLKEKEINLKDGINLIYGQNEAGKSTLIKFIINSFYGISKNKKGKEISDFEKYKPWSGEEFSGKLEYELDNNEKYEIYRDFNKKNPKIFNENMEDISKQFNIDKNKGNEFFYEQTKIDEDLFLSTLAINQREVKLEGQAQNFLIQKIANLAQTGDDSISFKRVIDRINRRQLDEVGTERSREKPINVVDRNLQELCKEKENLEKFKNFKYEFEEKESALNNEIFNLENEKNFLSEIKLQKENEKIENEKIKLKENLQKENLEKMNLLNKKIDELKINNKNILNKYLENNSVVGYATLVLAIIIISGIVIWYPRNKKVLRNRLKVKTKAGWFRFFYDLHVSGGFYAALLLLILALTGLTWSFGWYRNAFYSVFGISANPPQAHHAPASSGAKKPAKKKTDYTQWAEVLSALKSHYPDFNSITIQDGSATVSTARYGNTRGSDRYSFDPATGEITEVQLYKDLPKSGKIRGWIYSVHVGSWGGMTTRILTCLVSLLGTIFAITGYYFWIKKQFRKLR